MPLENVPSTPIVLFHLALTALVALGLVVAFHAASLKLGADRRTASRRALVCALGLGAWLAGTFALANRGWLLAPEAVPPRLLFVMLPGVVGTALLACAAPGKLLLDGLPLWVLVGAQAFRIAVELILWQLYRDGVLPLQMTFEGANWDVASGLGALAIAWLLRRGVCPRWALWLWNVAGLVLLANIMSIAVRSLPGPWRSYTEGPANLIVLHTVFVWIPALYVLTAWAGHVLVFRALLRAPRADRPRA